VDGVELLLTAEKTVREVTFAAGDPRLTVSTTPTFA
jgi:hypothetical protein